MKRDILSEALEIKEELILWRRSLHPDSGGWTDIAGNLPLCDGTTRPDGYYI